jgi:hypothetical protein
MPSLPHDHLYNRSENHILHHRERRLHVVQASTKHQHHPPTIAAPTTHRPREASTPFARVARRPQPNTKSATSSLAPVTRRTRCATTSGGVLSCLMARTHRRRAPPLRTGATARPSEKESTSELTGVGGQPRPDRTLTASNTLRNTSEATYNR